MYMYMFIYIHVYICARLPPPRTVLSTRARPRRRRGPPPTPEFKKGSPKSISPQGSGFQKLRSCPDTLSNGFTRSNTLA